MSSINPVSKIQHIIRHEEQRIHSSFSEEGRLGLMELARAMDYFWVRYSTSSADLIKEQHEIYQLTTFGLNKALTLFLDKSTDYPLFPLAESTVDSQQWADSVLQVCGRLGLAEQLLDLCRTGLGDLYETNSGDFRLRYRAESIDVEAHDREDFNWFRTLIKEYQKPAVEVLMAQSNTVWKMMADRVQPWGKHYIQYDAHPTIDLYYQTLGLLHAQTMLGQDSFTGETKFGDYDFNFYRAAVGILVGWTHKHMQFSLELLKKHKHLNPRNLLTVPQDIEVKASYLASALDIDEKAAQHALDVLTLTRKNIAIHCKASGNWVSPPLIQVGQGRIISCIWGSQSHPFQFLLTELKNRYRLDWDRGVDIRENIFRHELFELFPQPYLEKLTRNVRLKSNGLTLTDIDAVVFDSKTGVLGLFQLKWQDAFWKNLRERESRRKNLLKTGNQWIDTVTKWLAGRTPEGLGRVLGVTTSEHTPITKIRLRTYAVGGGSARLGA